MKALRAVIGGALVAICLSVLPAASQTGAYFGRPPGEDVLIGVPPGYRMDNRVMQGNSAIIEWVPTGETGKNWSEMLTLQVFQFPRPVTPAQFRSLLGQRWQRSCPGSVEVPIREGTENGYPFAFCLMDCPKSPMSGKREFTYFKAIQGNDYFFVVQKAFAFGPSKTQVEEWSRYMARIRACDPRRADRSCPARSSAPKG